MSISSSGTRVTVNNETFICPPWPIAISEEGRISVGNQSFVNLHYNLTSSGSRPSPFEFRVLNESMEIDASHLLNARIIQDSNASNKKWGGIEYTGKSSKIRNLISWSWSDIGIFPDYVWIISAVTGGAVMVVIVVVGCNRSRDDNPRQGANATHVEYNVYNQTPAPQSSPDFRELSAFLAKLVFSFMRCQPPASEPQRMPQSSAPREIINTESESHESCA